MQRRHSTVLSLALGAALIVAPSLTKMGSDTIFESAFAAKGGNGKGNGAGNGQGANSNTGGA
jgi:hypothetical protein